MKLTTSQTVALIVMVQFGVGILSLPSVLAAEAGSLGWVPLLAAGLFVQVAAFLYHFSLGKSTEKNLFLYMESLMGSFLSKCLTAVLLLYFLAGSAIIMRNYVFVLTIWSYHETPVFIIILLVWVCVVFLATCKIHSISRVAQIVFAGVLFLLLLLLWQIPHFEYSYLRFPNTVSPSSIFSGTVETSLSLIGFELILLFHFLLKDRRQTLKIVTISNWLTIGIYLFVVLIVFMQFSPEKLGKLIWPTLSVYKLIEFRFLQRLEYIIVFSWLPLIVITSGTYLWGAGKCARYLFSIKNRWVILILSLIIFAAALMVQRHPDSVLIGDYIGYVGVGAAFFVPLLFLCFKPFK
ncbi:GerAB/ArcD/ProY family transporter [Alteribacter natronophilus]|uniref:GerAB/ArcD/ProY family transporter n=1 Tax=Alteribacter natronophilus TaxID=2583810 RepID=UPI00110D954E|nr:GerAB/ArcD/ProY family transporter [Alteribacter natronophilus]TMW72773.1 hypothetical protein FGB90_00220 [Alteribacter natronophilus]